MSELTCTFTGHRAEKLPWGYNENDPRCRRLKQTLYDTLDAVYESGFRKFICGMAEGCDLYFCEAVLALCENHTDITLKPPSRLPDSRSAGARHSGSGMSRSSRAATPLPYCRNTILPAV